LDRFFTDSSKTSEQQWFSVTPQDREMQSTVEDAEVAEESQKHMSTLTLCELCGETRMLVVAWAPVDAVR